MKNKLLSGVAGLAVVAFLNGYGLAADLPVKAVRPAPPVLGSWTGLYLGGHIMYGGGDVVSDSVGPGSAAKKNYNHGLNLSGFGAGLHAGYNWQQGQWVYGVEGDVTITPWDNSASIPVGPSGKKTHQVSSRLGALSSLRGRLGVAFDRTLVYATGGVAIAQSQYDNVQTSKVARTFGGRQWDVGGVAGGGIEYKYNSNLSLRLEGLYYFFDSEEKWTTDTKKGIVLTRTLDNIGVVRLGANWHY
jgi:outer membrane immunogenic protein